MAAGHVSENVLYINFPSSENVFYSRIEHFNTFLGTNIFPKLHFYKDKPNNINLLKNYYIFIQVRP